jgi:hypothetical protein
VVFCVRPYCTVKVSVAERLKLPQLAATVVE